MVIHTLLGIKIPFTVPAFVAFAAAVLSGGLFLWWWFRKRQSGQAGIRTIVTGSPPSQEGELQVNGNTLFFIHRNKLFQRPVTDVVEIRVKESSSPRVYQFQIEVMMRKPPHLVLQAQNRENQLFINRILTTMEKDSIDWYAPLPQLHKLGNMTVKGYKIKV